MPNAMLPRLSLKDPVLRAAFLTSFSSVWLLVGYEMVRSPSNTLFKAAYGTEGLTWVLAIAPFFLLLLLYLYGRTLTRFGPRKTLLGTLVASAVGILVSWGLIHQGVAAGAALLILIREAYAVLVIEQYWSYLNSILDEPRAKRVNGPITGFSALGGVLGGLLVAKFGTMIAPESWLLWSLLSFIPSLLCAALAYRITGEPQREPAQNPAHSNAFATERVSDPMGLQLFRSNPTLLLLFAVILCTQVLSTLLDIHFQTLLQVAIPEPRAQTAYSGSLFMWMNGLSFGIQFLIAPFLLRWVPLPAVQMAIPIVNLAFVAYAWSVPTVQTAFAAFLVFKGMDYSIFRASKEILYIPFSFDVRYRAKEVIDAFGYRFGKGGASFALFVARKSGAAISAFYLPAAFAAGLAWLVLVSVLFTRRRERSVVPPGH